MAGLARRVLSRFTSFEPLIDLVDDATASKGREEIISALAERVAEDGMTHFFGSLGKGVLFRLIDASFDNHNVPSVSSSGKVHAFIHSESQKRGRAAFVQALDTQKIPLNRSNGSLAELLLDHFDFLGLEALFQSLLSNDLEACMKLCRVTSYYIDRQSKIYALLAQKETSEKQRLDVDEASGEVSVDEEKEKKRHKSAENTRQGGDLETSGGPVETERDERMQEERVERNLQLLQPFEASRSRKEEHRLIADAAKNLYARLLDPVTPEGFQFDYDDFLKQQEDIIRMPLPEKSPPPSPLPSTPSETALAQSAELSPTMPPPVQSVNVSHAAQFLATRYTSPTPPGASTDVATILGRARGDWRSPLPPARSLYPQHLSLSLSPRERLALRPSQPMRSPSPLPPLPKFSLAPSPMPKILTPPPRGTVERSYEFSDDGEAERAPPLSSSSATGGNPSFSSRNTSSHIRASPHPKFAGSTSSSPLPSIESSHPPDSHDDHRRPSDQPQQRRKRKRVDSSSSRPKKSARLVKKTLDAGGAVDLDSCDLTGVLTDTQNQTKRELALDFFFERRDRPRRAPQRDRHGKLVSGKHINLRQVRASVPRREKRTESALDKSREAKEHDKRRKKRKRRVKNPFELQEEKAKASLTKKAEKKSWYEYVSCFQARKLARISENFDFTPPRYRASGDTKLLFSDSAFHKHGWPKSAMEASDSENDLE